ncbi:hypothetical protein JCM33374_g1275 [Metschnikowia sp. JCM 33374]|nr:hypothetical protein JCM33374_g1275 [Metschnikowia sp. JCM 33374]
MSMRNYFPQAASLNSNFETPKVEGFDEENDTDYNVVPHVWSSLQDVCNIKEYDSGYSYSPSKPHDMEAISNYSDILDRNSPIDPKGLSYVIPFGDQSIHELPMDLSKATFSTSLDISSGGISFPMSSEKFGDSLNLTPSEFPYLSCPMSPPQNSNTPASGHHPKMAVTSKRENDGFQDFTMCPSSPEGLQGPNAAFEKFLPLLKELRPPKFAIFLVKLLRENHEHVSLDEFYRLLFDWTNTRLQFGASRSISGVLNPDCSDSKFKEYTLCYLVIQMFKDPEVFLHHFPKHAAENSLLYSVNFHEFLRVFLAVKILFVSVKEVEKSSVGHTTVPRIVLYKSYYIICQKLIDNNPAISNVPGFENMILSESHWGKLTRLVFPNLIVRRLGGRKHSKAHYVNLKWNTSVVDADILKKTGLELEKPDVHFPKQPSTFLNTPRGQSVKTVYKNQNNKPTPKACEKPSHSFLEISYTFPSANCSPRVWKKKINTIPKLTKWGEEKLQNSLEVLEGFHVHLHQDIKNFNAAVFSGKTNDIISRILISSTDTLLTSSAPPEAYKHLYLLGLLLVFPVVISSDKEIPFNYKTRFRESIITSVTKLETESTKVASIDQISLKIFIGLLKKMASLNELTSCKFDPHHAKKVLIEMICDMEVAADTKRGSLAESSPIEEAFMNSLIFAMNAYNFKFEDERCTTGDNSMIEALSGYLNSFKNIFIILKEEISKLSAYANNVYCTEVPQDLPYKVFKTLVEVFHEATLADPNLVKIPIPIFKIIRSNLLKRPRISHSRLFVIVMSKLQERHSSVGGLFP